MQRSKRCFSGLPFEQREVFILFAADLIIGGLGLYASRLGCGTEASAV